MRRILVYLGVLVIALCTLGGVLLRSGGTAQAQSSSGSQPNFVFVLTDDLAWNLVAHMPNVLSISRTGMTLSNYYVVDSLCCPSRTAIFTGEYPHNNGVFTNTGSDGGYAAFNAHGNEAKSFALALQQAGYQTGFMGKYLNGYQPKDPPAPGWDTWAVAGNGYPEFNYDLNENGAVKHYGRSANDYMVDVLAGKAVNFIDTASTARKPFFLEVATFAPHTPYTPAPRDAGSAKAVPYPKTAAYDTLPTNPPSYLKNRAPLRARQQNAIRTAYDKRVEAVQAVDDLIGRVVAELRTKDLLQNTYVIFSSDNGYHMGEYRLLPGKQTAFDTDIHVPLIVMGPGIPAGSTSAQLTSNIDLAPTFESLAWAPIGAKVDGLNMADLWRGRTPAQWRQAVLIEHHGPNSAPDDPDAQTPRAANPPSYEALRTANGLYVRYDSGEQEYYDTTTDPNELSNLAPAGVPADLPKVLSALQRCQGSATCLAASRY